MIHKIVAVLMMCAVMGVSTVAAQDDPISQWASDASASSEYESERWSAEQATGEPDAPDDCKDSVNAWASRDRDDEEYLQLEYDIAVIPLQVNVYQNYAPGAITSVSLVTPDGDEIELRRSADRPGNTDCPGVFELEIDDVEEAVNGVILYFDMSIVGDWNEIDAVELVGIPVEEQGGSKRTNSRGGQDARGIEVECPDGTDIENGVEFVVNMRAGFSYTVTALGIDDFDPILAVQDEFDNVLCDDNGGAREYEASLPTTGRVRGARSSGQIQFTYNGSGFGNVSFIVGEANGNDGEFIAIVEGLAVTTADGVGDGAGDPFSIHLTPNMQASEVPVTAYMISVTNGLDAYVYLVDGDNRSFRLENGDYVACDDAGRRNYCYGRHESLTSSYVSRLNGTLLPGGEYDASLTIEWDDLGMDPQDEGYITLRMTSSGQATYGDYVVVFHMGTASEFAD